MEKTRASPYAIVLALLVAISSLLLAPQSAFATGAASKVEVPDFVGEPLDLSLKAIDALDLESKVTAGGRAVFIKKNWVVIKQSPAAGKKVETGTVVKLTVIKKSEVVKEGTALGMCRGWAKTDDTIPYGIDFPWGSDWVSVKQDLGWAIDADGWLITSTDGRVAARVYCEVGGTDKKPVMLEYEVTER